MKKIKTISIILIIFAMTFMLGCSSSELTVPEQYNYDDLTRYVKLADYRGLDISDIEADTSFVYNDRVLDKICEKSKVLSYPDEEYQEKYDAKLADFDESNQKKVKGYEQMLETYVKSDMSRELVIYAIAQKEGIEFTSEGYIEYIENILEASGTTIEKVTEEEGITLEEYAEKNEMFNRYITDTVIQRIVEYAKN